MWINSTDCCFVFHRKTPAEHNKKGCLTFTAKQPYSNNTSYLFLFHKLMDSLLHFGNLLVGQHNALVGFEI